MLRNLSRLIFATLSFGLISAYGAEQYLSPMALAPSNDGSVLYVAECTANQIAVLNLAEKRVVGTIALPTPPNCVVLSADGKALYATGATPDGQLFVIDPASCKVTEKIDVGHTPAAITPAADGNTVYVCNRFNNAVGVVDIAKGKQVATIAVAREPHGAVLSKDGKLLFVLNHLPTGAADGEYISAEISVVDTAAGNVVKKIQLPNGSTGLRGICASPDGKFAYVTHVLARYHMPTTQLERGWMNTNALSIVDLEKQELVNSVLLDDVDLGAANPWGVTCSADGKWLCVAHAGTHEVSVIERAKLHEKLDKVAAGEKVSVVSRTPEDVPNDLSFLVGMRRRLKLAGNGPRGIAIVGSTAYTAEYFTDTIGVVDLSQDVRHTPTSLALGPKQIMNTVRKGEMFFNDAALCFQHWQSCASCHPDVRADGLNWDLLNDGMGNPKQTKSLVWSHKTPPVMVSGVRDKAETAVRAGIRYIQFAVRPDSDAEAIDAFLTSVEPVPSPYLVNGKLSKSAKKGKKIFKKAGCAACHPDPLYTNLKSYDLKLGQGLDENRKFDTPTIVENWRTAPYLYDGRAATMEEVLTKHNPGDVHGKTSKLNAKQLADLAEFILSQ